MENHKKKVFYRIFFLEIFQIKKWVPWVGVRMRTRGTVRGGVVQGQGKGHWVWGQGLGVGAWAGAGKGPGLGLGLGLVALS